MLAELCKAELSSLEWWIWMKSSPFVFWWKHIAHNVFNWDFVISLLPLADIKAQKFHSNFWVTKFNSVSQTNWTDTYKCMMVCLKQSALSALHYTWGNEGLKPHFWTPKNPFSKLICKLTNGPQTSCIFQSYTHLGLPCPGCAASTDVTELRLHGKVLVADAAAVAPARRYQRVQDRPGLARAEAVSGVCSDNVFKKGWKILEERR